MLAVSRTQPAFFRHFFVDFFTRPAAFVNINSRIGFLRNKKEFGNHHAGILYNVFYNIFAVFHLFGKLHFLFGG